MNKSSVNASMTVILLTVLLTACSGKQSGNLAAVQISSTEQISESPAQISVSPSIDPSQSPTPDPAAVKFKEGVFVDVQALDDPLINQDIKDLLNKMMKALVDRDEATYTGMFKESGAADYYREDVTAPIKFRFEQAGNDVIQKDSEGRVSLPVSGKVLREGQVNDFSWWVYFRKDDQGVWQLIAID